MGAGRDLDATDVVRVHNADGRRAHPPISSAFGFLGQGAVDRVMDPITRFLGPPSSPARSSAARRSSPAQRMGCSQLMPPRFLRFGR